MVLTTSRSLLVSDPTFQVPTRTLLGSPSLLTLRICRVKCEDPCIFFTTPGRRCSTSLRMRRSNPYSLNTVSRSRYDAPPRGWRPDPCPFNIIPEFRYGTSLRGLHPNDFSCGFISTEMAKIVVGSPSLTQPLLLYPGLGSTMLDNIGGVKCHLIKQKNISSSAKCNLYNIELTQKTKANHVHSKSKSLKSKCSYSMQFRTCHAQVQSYILSFIRIQEKINV
jgi:hypothetical protein